MYVNLDMAPKPRPRQTASSVACENHFLKFLYVCCRSDLRHSLGRGFLPCSSDLLTTLDTVAIGFVKLERCSAPVRPGHQGAGDQSRRWQFAEIEHHELLQHSRICGCWGLEPVLHPELQMHVTGMASPPRTPTYPNLKQQACDLL